MLMNWMDAGMASWAMRILMCSWEATESGIVAETIAGRLNEPKMVNPSRRRKAEYVAKGIRVRPIERAVLGTCGSDLRLFGVEDALTLWPKSWANLTSFQMPTEELTRNVDAKVVMPAMAWSILGYILFKMVSDALAVAKVAV